MGERLMTAANSQQQKGYTVFASTRFGNVIGSNGSVVPTFHNQIITEVPSLSPTKMTRFVMNVSDAVKLVLHSAQHAQGGEVFVTNASYAGSGSSSSND